MSKAIDESTSGNCGDATQSRMKRAPRMYAAENMAELLIVDNEAVEPCMGRILDVSEGGVCFQSPLGPPANALVELRIRVDDTQYEFLAIVRWVNKIDSSTYDCGLQFMPGEAGEDGVFGTLLLRELGNRSDRARRGRR